MKEEDKKFTVFEIGGKHYECNRLSFGVTNTVPAFHTIIDNFVNRNKLGRTYSLFHDILFGGPSDKEHD